MNVEILYKNWKCNNFKIGDDVRISLNLKRETDYGSCYVTEMEKQKNNEGKILDFSINNNTPIVKVLTKNCCFWYSFNHITK